LAKVSFQTWDSRFFGFTVVDAVSNDPDGGDLTRATAEAGEMGASLLVYTKPMGPLLAPRTGVRHVDIRHTYVCDFNCLAFDRTGISERIVFHDGPESSETIDRLGILSGIHSRFFVDPDFPRPAAEGLYIAWVRRALTREFGDHVLVARDDAGDIAALYSGRVDSNGIGVPDLMSVLPHFRGHSLGTGFLKRSMLHFRDRGILQGRLKSQGRNQFARAIYESLGWTLEAREDVYHVWLKEPVIKDAYL
tara:strand:+ start:265 stop:1011 length:747 start_codon:yes stop_codon:yes gene_type:complete